MSGSAQFGLNAALQLSPQLQHRRGTTRRRSHCTRRPWLSGRWRWARSTPTWRTPSPTSLSCTWSRYQAATSTLLHVHTRQPPSLGTTPPAKLYTPYGRSIESGALNPHWTPFIKCDDFVDLTDALVAGEKLDTRLFMWEKGFCSKPAKEEQALLFQ